MVRLLKLVFYKDNCAVRRVAGQDVSRKSLNLHFGPSEFEKYANSL